MLSIDIPHLEPNIQVTILYQNMALMMELMEDNHRVEVRAR